jgi:hypothetical protein
MPINRSKSQLKRIQIVTKDGNLRPPASEPTDKKEESIIPDQSYIHLDRWFAFITPGDAVRLCGHIIDRPHTGRVSSPIQKYNEKCVVTTASGRLYKLHIYDPDSDATFVLQSWLMTYGLHHRHIHVIETFTEFELEMERI